MASEQSISLLDSETRFIFAHARTREVFHQAWGETTFSPVPRSGEQVTLTSSAAKPSGPDGQWKIDEHDQFMLLVKEVEYTYNWVHFQDDENEIDTRRLLTDVWVYGEPIQMEFEEET